MNIKPILGFALLLCITGCTSIRTSTMHCTSLSREEQVHIFSDLNRMLVSDGFTASSLSENPWGMAWSNGAFSPLWKGRADFGVGFSTNSVEMRIDIFYYRGGRIANKAVINAVLACIQSNAPNAQVKIKVNTELAPAIPFKQ